MNCWRVQNLVAPFLDGELPDAESEAVGRHVESCPACRKTVSSVQNLPAVDAPRMASPSLDRLLSSFDRCLWERIAQGAPLSVEELDETRPPNSSVPARMARGLLLAARAEMRLPAAAVLAYACVVMLLGGAVLVNFQRVEALQASVDRREIIIDALQQRLAAADSDPLPALAGLQQPGDDTVFLPAAAPGVLTASPFQVGAVAALAGTAYRRVAWEGPRVLH
jgi:anti-sigma factor RsiW